MISPNPHSGASLRVTSQPYLNAVAPRPKDRSISPLRAFSTNGAKTARTLNPLNLRNSKALTPLRTTLNTADSATYEVKSSSNSTPGGERALIKQSLEEMITRKLVNKFVNPNPFF